MHTSVAKHERAAPAVPRNSSMRSKSSWRIVFARTNAEDREKTTICSLSLGFSASKSDEDTEDRSKEDSAPEKD